MSDQPKKTEDMTDEEFVQWYKSRTPLFIDSIEYEGVSLCFVNPELLKDETCKPEQPKTDAS